MPFGLMPGSGGGNWLTDLLKALSGGGRGAPAGAGMKAFLEAGSPTEPPVRAPSWAPPEMVDMALRTDQQGNVLPQRPAGGSPRNRILQNLMAKPVTTGLQRSLEATPAMPAGPVSTGVGRAIEAMPAPLATDQGPSLNEPAIPEPAAPELEPTGDGALWESALQHPDLLRQAEGGQMTSLDLLKALLERRNAGPRGIGGPQ